MAVELTVAVQMGGLLPFAHPFERQDDALPYPERRRAVLQAEETDTLGSVLGRAMDTLGVTIDEEARAWGDWDSTAEALTFVDFYEPEHEDGIQRPYRRYYVTTVDEDGCTWWEQDFRKATLGDLIRASEAGFLKGDPRRPYLVLAPAAGNGPLLTWSLILAGLMVAEKVLATVSSIDGVAGLVERLRRTQGAREAVDETFLDFEERGAHPGSFRESLHEGPWASNDLAGHLGCSVERAEGLLEGYGFTRAESGLWRLGDDPDSRFMSDVLEEIAHCHSGFESVAIKPEVALRDRLRHLAVTGERLPVPELEGLPDFESMSEEEIEAWSREQSGDEEPGAEVLTPDDDEEMGRALEDGLAVPYEHLQVRCACGRSECDARMEFERVRERLRMRLVDTSDHFEITADFLAAIALHASVDHESEEQAPG